MSDRWLNVQRDEVKDRRRRQREQQMAQAEQARLNRRHGRP
jgi:hypothetical protein